MGNEVGEFAPLAWRLLQNTLQIYSPSIGLLLLNHLPEFNLKSLFFKCIYNYEKFDRFP